MHFLRYNACNNLLIKMECYCKFKNTKIRKKATQFSDYHIKKLNLFNQ